MSIFDDDMAEQNKNKKLQRRLLDIREAERKDAVISLFQTRQGRTYLWSILELCGLVNEHPYRQNDRDTAFACGEMNIGIQLRNHMIECSPEAFADMMKEQLTNARHSSDTARAANPDDSDGTDDAASDSTGRPERSPAGEPAEYD